MKEDTLAISVGFEEKQSRPGLHWEVPVPSVGHWSPGQRKPGAQGQATCRVRHF